MSIVTAGMNAVRSQLGGGSTPKAAGPPVPPPPPPTTPTPAPRQVAKLTDGTNSVIFQFRPNTIKVSHSADTKAMNRSLGVAEDGGTSRTIVAGSATEAVMNVGDTTISFGDIVFDGEQAVTLSMQLLKWTYPFETKAATKEEPAETSMPLLTFTWGRFTPGTSFGSSASTQKTSLVLTKVDVDYSRFDNSGTPKRAKVTIATKVKVNITALQNPTSGGLSDRGGHVMVDGENLMGIAAQRYGTPGRWRELAELNGIDDPLRVRPGHRVYLPDATELRGSRP
jgi:hypothetical protein